MLLCDEPTSALDVSLAATVLNLLGRLRRELGMAVIFVTHDLAAARIVADRIAVMYLGRIVDIGTADEICERPDPPVREGPAVDDARVAGTCLGSPGDPANALAPPSGCGFHPRCPVAVASLLGRRSRAHPCSVTGPSPGGRRVVPGSRTAAAPEAMTERAGA